MPSENFCDSPMLRSLSESTLSERYYRRLGLDPKLLDDQPSFEKLSQITEAHVGTIPFENIAQHGGKGGAQTLNLLGKRDFSGGVTDDNSSYYNSIASKVLDRNRGGFCFELNGLLGYWLQHELKYPSVCRVPARVYRGLPTEFNTPPTHLILIVGCCTSYCPSTEVVVDSDTNKGCKTDNTVTSDPSPAQKLYVVDVGFGEPPLHPIKYDMDVIQVTPEGMVSKLTHDKSTDEVTLHWYTDTDGWVPRLRWLHKDTEVNRTSSTGRTLESFLPMLHVVQQPQSNFAQKLIVCKVTRTQKITLAGTKLKITGPPRFSHVHLADLPINHEEDNGTNNGSHLTNTTSITNCQEVLKPKLVVTYFSSSTYCENNKEFDQTLEIRTKVLLGLFGIPLEETTEMDFSKSSKADPEVWSQL